MAYSPNNPNGQATAANSAPVVLASDQGAIAVNTAPASIIGTPTSVSMAALNATVGYTCNSSAGIYLSLTNAPGATAAWVGTVTFQYSINGGSSYSALTVYPVGGPTSSGGVTTATANGLWYVMLPSAIGTTISPNIFIRANMGSYTSGTAYFFASSASMPNAMLSLPWTYTVTTANTVVGPLDASGIQEIDVQMSAITTAVYTWQGTNDPSLTTWNPIDVQDTGTQTTGAATIAAAPTGAWRMVPSGFRWVRLQCTTTGTVFTVQGVVAKFGNVTVLGGYGNAVAISNTPAVTVSSGTVTTVSTVSNITTGTIATVTNGNAGFPASINDTASAAITTTTTSGPYTPTYGTAYQVLIDVTAVSGTTPTMDTVIQESRDGGTNYVSIYAFPRITATGSYSSPVFYATGNRVQYVQTIAGTTPSFTRANYRIQSSATGKFVRQIFDRTITLTSLSSTTAALIAEQQGTNVTMTINIGATTIAPILQIQASDDAGATWYNIGTTLTSVASSTVSLTVTNITAQQFRAIVTTAGTGTTAGYVMLRSF